MAKKFIFVLAAVLFLTPVLVYGAVIKTGDSYYLDPGSEINDNLYAAGGNVSVAGTVNGDLFVAGGNLILSGPVSGDVAAAGGTVNVSGNVSGDVRVAGGNVNILNSTGGELLAAGGQVNVSQGSFIEKGVKIIGGNINFDGRAKGKVSIKGENVYINGTIEQDLSVEAKEVKLGPNALIQGSFDYYSTKQAVVEQGAQVLGALNFHKTEITSKAPAGKGLFLGFIGFAWIVKSLMIIVVALIMVYFFKNHTNVLVQQSVSSFWKEFLRGFIILVVVPAVVILSLITVLGVYVAIIVGLFYAMILMISSATTVLVFAKLAMKYIFKKEDCQLNWWVVIIATFVLGLIALIPFVGWILPFIIFLSAFGSTTNYIYKKIRT